ncbi:MAG: hypothetical protein CBC67_00790 [Gammaproteobacteria bacterium TMED107]|nr:hypothetical protein [Gammaproteobacteria bacterium]OUX77460.1 MAG: hypothetical protein CBC67_00790 [Gammaproteobacteria bacterium TMED107]
MQDSNLNGQAAVAVSPARLQRPAKAPALLQEKDKVGKTSRLNPSRRRNLEIKTPKMAEMEVQVSKMAILMRFQTVVMERSRPQALETNHGKMVARDLAKPPVRLRGCQPEKPAVAMQREIFRIAQQMAERVVFKAHQMAL